MNEVSIFDAFVGRISQFFTEFSWQGIKEVSLNSIITYAQNYENILKPA